MVCDDSIHVPDPDRSADGHHHLTVGRTIPAPHASGPDRGREADRHPGRISTTKSPVPNALRRRQDRRASVHTEKRTGFTAVHVGHHARRGTRHRARPLPGPEGRHPRIPGVPLQVQGPRPAPRQRPAGPRAPGQADRSRRVRVRRAVVHRLRQRGDPPHPAARRRRRRPPGLQPARADHAGPGRGAGHPDLQLSPDHQGLPLGRRRLHRHQGQPRPAARPGRRRRPAHRLHPHRLGIGLRRCRRPLQRLQPAVPLPGPDRPGLHRHHLHRQPPWGQGVGEDLRRPDLPVHRRHVPDDPHRGVQGHLRRWARARDPRGPGGPRGHGCRHDPARPPRLRLRRRGHDGRRGHLQRRTRLQAGRVEARPRDPHDHGRAARHDVHRDLVARRQAPGRAERVADRDRPDRRGRLRQRPRRPRAVPVHPGRHHAHPGAGGQHELRRLPPPGELPRRRRLHAQAAHQARAPAGVLERHHRPGRRRCHPGDHLPGRRHQADPALRHRRVHLLHPEPGRHGPQAHQGQGERVEVRPVRERPRRPHDGTW